MPERVGGVVLDDVAVATAAFNLSKMPIAVNLFGANGVTTDAQWSVLMDNIFSTTKWPGVHAGSLAVLAGFFKALVNVTPNVGPGSNK